MNYREFKAQVDQAYNDEALEAVQAGYRKHRPTIRIGYAEFTERFGFVTDTMSRLTGLVPVDLDGSHTSDLSRMLAHAALDAFGIDFDPDTVPVDLQWHFPDLFPDADFPPGLSPADGAAKFLEGQE